MNAGLIEVPPDVRGIFFTDLDGTLLDFDSYQPSPVARELLTVLARRGVVVVPVSSKTAAEVHPLIEELKLSTLAITEGGAVVLSGDGEEVVGLGRSDLIGILEDLQSRGWPIRGMSQMTVKEVVERTGLSPEAAVLAMTRSASEPFVPIGGSEICSYTSLAAAVLELGADVIRGGRFWHLMTRGINKATGVLEVIERLDDGHDLPTAAVGDAWNDLPMLAEVGIAFLLGDAVETTAVPDGVIRLDAAGPRGFAVAAGRVLDAWR